MATPLTLNDLEKLHKYELLQKWITMLQKCELEKAQACAMVS